MRQLEEVIEKSNGKIFTVTFVKKDGTLRTLNGRLGVSKYVKGTGAPKPDNLFTVFEINKGQYRSVVKDAIVEVKFGGETYRAE